MINRIVTTIGFIFALCMFAIASSSEAGFKFIHFFVIIGNFMESIVTKITGYSTILDPGYIKFWLSFIIISALILPPAYGVWYELRKLNKK